MNTKYKVAVFSAAASLAPFLALAQTNPEQTCSNIRNLTGVFQCALGLVGYLIAICFTLAFLFFFWNLAMYIKDYDNEAKRQDSRQYMIYGIIAIFVMMSAWGLVSILRNTFGFGGTPQFNAGQQQQQSPGGLFGGVSI